MEAECFELDLNIFAKSAEGNHTSDSINKQILLSRQLKNLQDEKEKLKNEMDFINSATIAQVLHNPEDEIQIKSMYRTRLDEIQRELHEKVFYYFFIKYHWYIWKSLKQHLDLVLCYISNEHSHKNIKVLFVALCSFENLLKFMLYF